MEETRKILKQYYGYENFRKGQDVLIERILKNQDVLGIMPTGAGKSICYQIPALILRGTTIVISPLISLMKDQVDSLNEMGIVSTYINSTLTANQYRHILHTAREGTYKLIYVAPERLETESFQNLIRSMEISMVAIDEAHCVSEWGHDFRKSYKEISKMIHRFEKRPKVAAFTATATEMVKNDIIQLLELQDPYVLVTGFDRENLRFSVEKPANRKNYILKYLNTHKGKSGIIYCATRKNVDMLYQNLQELGYSVTKYHAGLTEKTRRENQEDFIYDRREIMIATNAFGMGIDKSNIRFVLHYNMPRTMENYYQEAGRSGRDGEEAECILLFSRADIVTNKFLIEQGNPEIDRSNEYQKLNDMIDYCNTDKCLRKYILEYFGETPDFDRCEKCGNCNNKTELVDITVDAQKIMSCIKRMGERFGSNLVTEVLKGANTAKIRQFGFQEIRTYGLMRECNKEYIKELIAFLISEGYLIAVGDKFPIIQVGAKSENVLFGKEKVMIKRNLPKVEQQKEEYEIIDIALLERLKEIRKELSIKYQVPPFIIFSDASLIDMSRKYPKDEETMLKITGVGKFKYDKYGEVFLNVINEYREENQIQEENRNNEQKTTMLKRDTTVETYELLKQGKQVEEIAKIRGLTKQTIETHIINCFERGLPIDMKQFIHTEYQDQIIKAIEICGGDKLKPIKEMLPQEVSYMDIKYYLISGRENG